MRIPAINAKHVAQKRHIYLKELILYSNSEGKDCINCFHSAMSKSIQSSCMYMDSVDKLPVVSEEKLKAYADGVLSTPAYMAQSSLDWVISKGYTPQTSNEKRLLVSMFLVRREIQDGASIERFFPLHWSETLKNELLALAEIQGAQDYVLEEKKTE